MSYSCCGMGGGMNSHSSERYMGLMNYSNVPSPAGYGGALGTGQQAMPHLGGKKREYEPPMLMNFNPADYLQKMKVGESYDSSHSAMPTTSNTLAKYVRGEVSPVPLMYDRSVMAILNSLN